MGILALGTETQWGVIIAVQWIGERYYSIADQSGSIALLPASVVEPCASTSAPR